MKILCSSKKLINALKVGINCLAEINLKALPVLLIIEATNHCNMGCLMCPNKTMVRKRGCMDLSLFKKIVDQTSSYAWEYAFNVFGEPTLNKDLKDMVSYTKKRGCKVALYTNMNYKDSSVTDWIIRSNVDQIVVNIAAASQKVYNAITQNGNYDLVLYNLKNIWKSKKRIKKRKPTIVISYSIMDLNRNEAATDIKFLKKYSDYIMAREIHDWSGNSMIKRLSSGKNRYDFVKKCSYLWTSVVILWDGKVVACCYDHEGRMVLGNVHENNIYDIFNSQKAKQFRNKYRNSGICQNCSNAKSFQFSIQNLYDQLRMNS